MSDYFPLKFKFGIVTTPKNSLIDNHFDTTALLPMLDGIRSIVRDLANYEFLSLPHKLRHLEACIANAEDYFLKVKFDKDICKNHLVTWTGGQGAMVLPILTLEEINPFTPPWVSTCSPLELQKINEYVAFLLGHFKTFSESGRPSNYWSKRSRVNLLIFALHLVMKMKLKIL